MRKVKEPRALSISSHGLLQGLYEAAAKLLANLSQPNVANLRKAVEALEKEADFADSPQGEQLRGEAMLLLHRLESQDDIDIDEIGPIYQADNGCWVAAWVWLPKQEEDDLDET